MFAYRPGILGIIKEGGRHFQGDESIFLNINACKQLSRTVRSSYGPNCMNKLIVNHIEKLFVTSDASTILEQLEIQHPAAKIAALAAFMQHQEFGDGTGYVILLIGELLRQAEVLLKEGLHVADIAKGYETAAKEALQHLESFVSYKINDIRDFSELTQVITSTITPKALGYETLISRLVAEAVSIVLPPNPLEFNTDYIRVVKLLGGGIYQSYVVHGMIVPRDATSVVKKKQGCKVMVLGCGLELTSTETKGTVLIHNAEQLMNFSKGEEEEMEQLIQSIVNAGVEAIIVGGNISDLAQHCCNKYKLLTLKCQSKFELRRICKTLGASSLIRLGTPTPEELGYAEIIYVDEVSSNRVCRIQTKDSRVATIVLRGATNNLLDELERAIGDGVRCIKNITKDNRFLPGAGSTELAMSLHLKSYGFATEELQHYAVLKFAEVFEEFPRILAENVGLSSVATLSQLHAFHKQGHYTIGVDTQGESTNGVTNILMKERDYPVVDHYKTKECAIKLSLDAVLTILLIDQIFMSRPAGGPKPPKQDGHWDDD